jgi:hypothetical protein
MDLTSDFLSRQAFWFGSKWRKRPGGPKAADQGSADGKDTIGRFYETGRGGLPKNDTQAAGWRHALRQQLH